MDFVRLDRADTVVTATRSLSPGSEVERIAIRSAIPPAIRSPPKQWPQGILCANMPKSSAMRPVNFAR